MNDAFCEKTGDNTRHNNFLKSSSVYLLLSTIALGIIFNILFFKKTLGISYPIFILIFYVVLFLNLRKLITFRLDFGFILTIPIVMLSSTYLFFSNPIFIVLNFIVIPVLIIVQSLLITKHNNFLWFDIRHIFDILIALFIRTLSHILKPFEITSTLIREKAGSGKFNIILKVFIGILISVPLLLVVIALLASADQVFSHWLSKIPDFFINIDLGNIFVQTLISIIIAFIFFSYLWSLIYENPKVPDSLISPKKVLDPVIILTILVMINIIYIVFTTIQFAYLFGNGTSILPPDISYSQYARRGFFELVLVTIINLAFLILSINLTKIENAIINKIFSILNSLLIGCTMVMLISAHIRMTLYENEYGYTYLRVLTHLFMAFIFIILIATLIKVWSVKFPLLKTYIVVSMLSYVILNYINIDVIIAHNNIKIYMNTNKIDTYYLSSFSDDAVPYMVQLLEEEDQEIVRSIENHLYLRKSKLEDIEKWQSFNLSRYKSRKVLSNYHLNYQAKKHYKQ